MKDPRLMPIENHEPTEDYADDFLEADEEELYDMLSAHKDKNGVKRTQLYIAS